jgi:hypothetical protein
VSVDVHRKGQLKSVPVGVYSVSYGAEERDRGSSGSLGLGTGEVYEDVNHAESVIAEFETTPAEDEAIEAALRTSVHTKGRYSIFGSNCRTWSMKTFKSIVDQIEGYREDRAKRSKEGEGK